MHSGGYWEGWAQLSGFLFTADLVVVFAAFARRWVSRELTLIGTALIATLPLLTAHATSGFADIEMSCYMLVGAVFLARVTVCGERSQAGVFALLVASMVFVKNEGLLTAVGMLIAIVLCARGKNLIAAAGCWGIGLAAYAPWLEYKVMHRLTNDLVQPVKHRHLTTEFMQWRYHVALNGFVECIETTGPTTPGWGLIAWLIPIGAVCSLLRRMTVCIPIWIVCGIQLFGYLLIYVITPHPLIPHLASSVDRLTLHLAPSLVMAALIGTFGRPEQNGEPVYRDAASN